MDEKSSDKPMEQPALAELRELVERAQAGDATALPSLRPLVEAQPEVWRHLAELAARVERSWLDLLSAEHPFLAIELKGIAHEMQTDLLGDHPTPLERLLVDQSVCCWLEVHHAEAEAERLPSGSVKHAGFRRRHLKAAQRRFQTAVKALRDFRTLVPAGSAHRPAPRLYEPAGPAKTEARRTAGTGNSTLTGGAGLDWFFVGLADTINGKT
jgi:hypothetical protein